MILQREPSLQRADSKGAGRREGKKHFVMPRRVKNPGIARVRGFSMLQILRITRESRRFYARLLYSKNPAPPLPGGGGSLQGDLLRLQRKMLFRKDPGENPRTTTEIHPSLPLEAPSSGAAEKRFQLGDAGTGERGDFQSSSLLHEGHPQIPGREFSGQSKIPGEEGQRHLPLEFYDEISIERFVSLSYNPNIRGEFRQVLPRPGVDMFFNLGEKHLTEVVPGIGGVLVGNVFLPGKAVLPEELPKLPPGTSQKGANDTPPPGRDPSKPPNAGTPKEVEEHCLLYVVFGMSRGNPGISMFSGKLFQKGVPQPSGSALQALVRLSVFFGNHVPALQGKMQLRRQRANEPGILQGGLPPNAVLQMTKNKPIRRKKEKGQQHHGHGVASSGDCENQRSGIPEPSLLGPRLLKAGLQYVGNMPLFRLLHKDPPKNEQRHTPHCTMCALLILCV
jgi:hypothetical protein